MRIRESCLHDSIVQLSTGTFSFAAELTMCVAHRLQFQPNGNAARGS